MFLFDTKTLFFNSTLCDNIDEAISISKRMQRAIRVDSMFISCLNADKVKQHYGISVVPHNYWDTDSFRKDEIIVSLPPSTFKSKFECNFKSTKCLKYCSGQHFR